MSEINLENSAVNNLFSGQDLSVDSCSIPSPISQTDEFSESESFKISLDRYAEEWAVVSQHIDMERLRKMAIEGFFRASRFRSVYWRIFLKILGRDYKKWASEVTDHRLLYDRLCEELLASPWASPNECSVDNPLSQDNGSVWCRYFCDEELRAIIRQDVIRTFPGIDFFHSARIQDLMVRILFLYARKNPTLCYRQGMHEVLAPILFVLHCDEQALAHAQEMGTVDSDLVTILDPQYLAADAFSLFTRVMTNVESSYAVPKQTFNVSQVEVNERDNEVIWRLEYIRQKLLSSVDPELADHLQMLDIPLQLFGIRWLRLLFGREFPLQDLLMLWDVIFTSDDFYLVDYIVVAMLVAIRQLLIGRDYTTCLSCLMRYPIGVDMTFVLQCAHHIMDPLNYPKPPQPPSCSPSEERNQNNSRTKVLPRLANLSLRPALSQQLLGVRHLAMGRSEQSSELDEGFTLQDPERLSLEVEHLRAVMTLVRIKISQYHSALQDVVYSSGNAEAFQALEGLHELCYLMTDPSPSQLGDIEPAYEAGESKISSPPAKKDCSDDIDDSGTILLDVQYQSHRPELDVFKHTFGGEEPIPGAPMIDPLRRKSKKGPADDWRQFSKELNKLGVDK